MVGSRTIITATALIAIWLGGAPGAAGADLDEAKFNVIGGLSITTQSKQLEQPFWKDKLPAASSNKLTATITPWNEMALKGPEVFRLVQRGVADAATGFLGHMAGDIPQNEGVDLAGLNPDFDQFKKVTGAYRPVLSSYYETLGLNILGMWSYQAQVIVCRDPITSLADLNGRKVRTSGASQANLVAHFGGSGVPIAFGEVQQSLVNGVIDCAISGTLGIYKAKWWEGAKHLYPLPITWGAIAFAMSSKKWNALSGDTQGFLKDQIAALEGDIWEQNAREHQEGIDCNGSGPCPHGEAAGITVSTVSDGDAKLLEEALVKTVLPAWAERCGADCVAKWNESVGKLVGLEAQAK